MKIKCKYCAAQLNIRDDLRGKKGRCPSCRADLLLVPPPSQTDALMSIDFSDAAMLGEKVEDPESTEEDAIEILEDDDFEALPELKSELKPKQKKAKAKNKSPEKDDVEDGANKKKRRKAKYSVIRMIAGVFDGPFWRSAAEHMLFVTLSLAFFGAVVGFVVGLIRSTVVASLMVNLIGIPSILFAYFMLCYPASCFWNIIVGSTTGGDDIAEWPESDVGEWVFDLLVVGYIALMSFFVCAGIAKIREIAIPGQVASAKFWQILGSVKEVNKLGGLEKVVGKDLANLAEVESSRPVIDPGPAWWTAFGAMIIVFPMMVISCLDESSPLLVPWSPRLWMSLIKNALAWLVAMPILALLMSVAMIGFILGANHAPFLTFTLCSPLVAVGIVVYGRLLGRLCWHISRT